MKTPVVILEPPTKDAGTVKPAAHPLSSSIRDSAVQFCQESTLHGLKNLVKDIQIPVQTKYYSDIV